MIIRKSSYNSIIVAIGLFLSACAPYDQLKDAREYLNEGNFVPAIMLYDRYMERNPHSAEKTIAELERSEGYYQLGLQAYNKKNWELSQRLLYLANSHKADMLADDVHLKMAEAAAAAGDTDAELMHYDQVINYIPKSDLVPLMLNRRIDIYLRRSQNISAYNDYKKLWDEFPMSEEADLATQKINPLMPWFLRSPRKMQESGNFAAAIAEFELYASYPSSYQPAIYQEIADTYLEWAQEDRRQQDYQALRRHLDLAIANNPQLQMAADQLVFDVCDEFLAAGDSLLAEGDINSAIEEFRRCYVVLPDMAEAAERISQAEDQRRRFAEADSLFAEAEKLENRKKYLEAQKIYQRVFELSGKKLANKKSQEMANYIRAEKNPQDFALEIIRDFQGGIIKRNVDKTLKKMIEDFGDKVSSSEWKAVYSYGEFNFEVRIDIFSPGKSYYYAWRVNLIERSISPLNKDSENVMK